MSAASAHSCVTIPIALLLAPSPRVALADTIVLKSGRKYEGRVVDQGDRYLLIQPDGRKLPFPKRIVKEVITPETVRKKYSAEYESRRAKASTPQEKWELAKLCEKWGSAKDNYPTQRCAGGWRACTGSSTCCRRNAQRRAGC